MSRTESIKQSLEDAIAAARANLDQVEEFANEITTDARLMEVINAQYAYCAALSQMVVTLASDDEGHEWAHDHYVMPLYDRFIGDLAHDWYMENLDSLRFPEGFHGDVRRMVSAIIESDDRPDADDA